MSEIVKPTPEQIADILAKHKAWLDGKPGGQMANLRGAYLGGANLRGAYLGGANLDGANLVEANLVEANLRGANLRGAYLRGAYLVGAYLVGANLVGANLVEANLRGAYLVGANLDGANLVEANLRGANLRGAYLGEAYLGGANLDGANLVEAYLVGAKLPTGETFEKYLSDVVPALLVAGGKTVEQIAAAGAFECHSWTNCPMHAAFGIGRAEEAPALLRPRVEQFVHLFDQGQVIAFRREDGTWGFKGPEYTLPDAPWAKEQEIGSTPKPPVSDEQK